MSNCTRLLFCLAYGLTGLASGSAPVLVSTGADGLPGAEDSGRVRVPWNAEERLVPSPVTDEGGVVFLSLARLVADEDLDVLADPYARAAAGAVTRLAASSPFASGNCTQVSTDRSGTVGYYCREVHNASELTQVYRGPWDDAVALGLRSRVLGAQLAADGDHALLSIDVDGVVEVYLQTFSDTGLDEALLTEGFDQSCTGAAISGDGAAVVLSSASVLEIPGGDPDTNGVADIFLLNTVTGDWERITRRLNTASGYHGAFQPALSRNGERVCFDSADGNFVAGDTNAVSDVFVWEGGETALVSRAWHGGSADGPSWGAWVSEDGRFVAFLSLATDLVPDTAPPAGAPAQVYVADRDTGRIVCVSRAADGTFADETCAVPALSPSGRYVTFATASGVLVDGYEGGTWQVYRVDRGASYANHPPETETFYASGPKGEPVAVGLQVSDRDGDVLSITVVTAPTKGALQVDGAPVEAGLSYPASSLPWSYVPDSDLPQDDSFVFRASDGVDESDATSALIRLVEPNQGTVARISLVHSTTEAVEESYPFAFPGLAAAKNGRWVAFTSSAALDGADTDPGVDLYLTDWGLGDMRLVSSGTNGFSGAGRCAMTPDGAGLVYYCQERGALVWHEVASGREETAVSLTAAPVAGPVVSDDGQVLVYSDDGQVYWLRRENGTPVLLSRAPDGTPGDGESAAVDVSGDGGCVVFSSTAANLVPDAGGSRESAVYVAFVAEGELALVADSGAVNPRLSNGARYLTYANVAGVQFLDRVTGTAVQVAAGAVAPALSADGRFVSYVLPAGGAAQVYRWNRITGEHVLVSHAAGAEADGISYGPVVAADGTRVVFASDASDLVPDDTNGVRDVFVNDFGSRENAVPVAWDSEFAVDEDTRTDAIELVCTDADGDDVVVEISEGPGHAEVFELLPVREGQGAWRVRYRALPDYAGTDSFRFRCRDAVGVSNEARVTVNVIEVNDEPVLSPVPDQQLAEGEVLTLQFEAYDPDTENAQAPDVLTFARVNGPGSVSTPGEYRFAPGYDTVMPESAPVEFTVEVEVSDGRGGRDTVTFTVTVEDRNAPPEVTDLTIAGAAAGLDTRDDLVPAYVFTDVDGDAEGASLVRWEWRETEASAFLVYEGDILPGGGVSGAVTERDQQWRFSVLPVDERGEQGVERTSAVFEIANALPGMWLVAGSPLQTLEDTSLEFVVRAVDADGDGLTLGVASAAANGRVTGGGEADGEWTLTYAPDRDYATEPGEYEVFVLRAEDGFGGRTDLTVQVSVTPVNDPPEIEVLASPRVSDGSALVAPGQTFRVVDVDSPESSLQLRIPAGGLPQKGVVRTALGQEPTVDTVLADADFPLVYTPNAGELGLDRVVLQADDGDAVSEPATVWFQLEYGELVLDLVPGWNLVGVALDLDTPEAAVAFARTETPGATWTVGPVWGWSADRQQYVRAERLRPGHGYWVYCDDVPAEGLRLRGALPGESSVNLVPGWNLVSGTGHGGRTEELEEGLHGRVWWAADGGYRTSSAVWVRRGGGVWVHASETRALDLFLVPGLTE
jgi:Tol biopolymer transport system component